MGHHHNTALGARGEEQAAAHYRSMGYTVVERNWRCHAGEIDLICASPDGRTLVFCEVKTRTSNAHGHPLEAVPPSKQRRLRHLAAIYLLARAHYREEIRFDVVAIFGHQLHVVKSAF
jgi:putative endonuclease